MYREELAPFARADDVFINVESGQMRFRSAAAGCAGEGSVTPHLDGQFGVYDVVLLIENCNAPYSHLNGELQGLATHAQSGYWDYDYWLVVFLAAPDGAPPRPALTMRAYPRQP